MPEAEEAAPAGRPAAWLPLVVALAIVLVVPLWGPIAPAADAQDPAEPGEPPWRV